MATADGARPAAATPSEKTGGVTTRSLVLAVALSVAGIIWIHQASLVQAPGQPYAPVYLLSVPPVPAVIFLFLLAASAAVMRRIFKVRPLSSRELMVIYIVLVIAIPPTTFGIIEMLLPWVTAPTYFGTPQDGLDQIAGQYFPSWAYPHDQEAIRTMFEGSDTGAIPWRPWLTPLTGWFLFCALIFGIGMCLITLFHRQWSEHERLRYPLLLLPLSVTEQGGHHAEVRGLFRNPLTWIAIAVVFIHHGINIAHSFNPSVMALMDRHSLGDIFTERPWTAFRSLTFFHRPQMIGFSYFVSVDVLFSGWFFFVIQMAIQMFADILGYQAPGGFPFAPQQGAGAFIALFLALVWVGKPYFAKVLTEGLSLRKSSDQREPMSHRLMVWGSIVGFALILIWCVQMRAGVWLAASYFGMLLAWAVVYARIRAEAGVASMWVFPFDQHPQVITSVVGTQGLMNGADPTQLVMLSLFSWFSRGYFPSLTGYVAENNKLAEEAGLKPRQTPWLMMFAFAIGMIGGYIVTLHSYYGTGANVLHGGTSNGGYNVRSAMTVWSGVSSSIDNPGPPNPTQILGIVAGAVATLGMVAARRVWLRFPFHPLGYAMALNYGYALWGPFLVTWAVKLIIDRLGGADWYRKLMPFFLGLAIGDLVAGGILWIVMGIFGPDITNGYMIQFG
ncbi:MAG: DUF6785 family protein [Bacteroidota bacterium]